MTQNEFNDYCQETMQHLLDLLQRKGEQYSPSGDALATYRTAAKYSGTTPQGVLLSRIVEKIERLRHLRDAEQPLSQDALLDIIGHTLFLLAFENEEAFYA